MKKPVFRSADDQVMRGVNAKQILFIIGRGNWCEVYTSGHVFRVDKPLPYVMRCLPQLCLEKLDRSTAVNLFKFGGLEGNKIWLGPYALTMGPAFARWMKSLFRNDSS
ncbi:hypothetical protein [Flavihumibacter petaseus]|uniref:Uncharacterized protein n=1 Tax=Flavihumibacter petaseus NBRC 106054 TaxID=1220578 RepID=A0A0E9MX64_9BACT|nr:hypothetical protein [Flavihumibacter petaseus]GAO42332.1 hypothetical protein FPE01S_01_13460 [Flavihumibacter petaseus NBRC 106054]